MQDHPLFMVLPMLELTVKQSAEDPVVSTGNFLAWMGENSFFVYDGTVREIPCEVHDYVYDNSMYQVERLVGADTTLTSMKYGGDSQAVNHNSTKQICDLELW